MTTVTLDTNVFPAEPLVARAQRVGIAVATITVSRREVEGSSLEEEVRALETVVETAVWGESRWGEAVWGSSLASERFERVLALLSNRSFPPTGQRDQLSNGQRRQLRDAMILWATFTRVEGSSCRMTGEPSAPTAAARPLKRSSGHAS